MSADNWNKLDASFRNAGFYEQYGEPTYENMISSVGTKNERFVHVLLDNKFTENVKDYLENNNINTCNVDTLRIISYYPSIIIYGGVITRIKLAGLRLLIINALKYKWNFMVFYLKSSIYVNYTCFNFNKLNLDLATGIQLHKLVNNDIPILGVVVLGKQHNPNIKNAFISFIFIMYFLSVYRKCRILKKTPLVAFCRSNLLDINLIQIFLKLTF